MKRTIRRMSPFGIAAAAWAVVVVAASPTRAMKSPEHHGPAPSHAARGQAAETAAGVWREIQEQVHDLDQLIKAKKLSQVHEVAFEIRDLVRTLPDRSPALSADKQKTLVGYVKQVDQAAKMLDEAGDSKNLKATKTHRQHLHQVLMGIERLYPTGALGASHHGTPHGRK